MDDFNIQEKMPKLSFRLTTDVCRVFCLLLGRFWGFLLFGWVFFLFCFGFSGLLGFLLLLRVFFLGGGVFIRKQERVVFKSFLSLGSNHTVCKK